MRCNDGCACLQMGGAASKPADIASLASSAVEYQPPLGPPNPVSLQLPFIRWLGRCLHSSLLITLPVAHQYSPQAVSW